MWISRVRVNGGFLAGLDVHLESGLNVVVGARGAGKTTLLELIRHALGIEHADEGVAQRQQQAVAQLLGHGEVILDLESDESSRHLVVDSAGAGRSSETSALALALGQNELEQIASSSASRLSLIDLRASVDADPPSLDSAMSLTQQLADANAEIERLAENTARRALLEADRAEASAEEQALLNDTAADIADRRELLRGLESELLLLTNQSELASAAIGAAGDAQQLAAQLTRAVEAITPNTAGVNLTALLSPAIESIRAGVSAVNSELEGLASALSRSRSAMLQQQNALRLDAEPVRAELEAAEVGLGQVTARLRNIDTELAQLARSDERLQQQHAKSADLRSTRELVLDEFEAWQESLFEARRQVADSVSTDLQSRVVVSIEHLADTQGFRDRLIELLQGSGLQYRPLSESLAKSLIPRQLLSLVEANDATSLADATGITTDRAARVIAHLTAPHHLGALAKCTLDDQADFRLRDGATDKSVDELSTGQKCAVTLPIVLTELSRILILDQPEDHLDNGYLVDNVVGTLGKRGANGAQTIVATHNANIPVLGSAPRVISLGSDGSRGYVSQSGSFDDELIVAVITSLMEGGRDAFRRRAEFYAEHGENQ